eukprot:jgi/Mesvir1/8652/Mv02596-RA.1
MQTLTCKRTIRCIPGPLRATGTRALLDNAKVSDDVRRPALPAHGDGGEASAESGYFLFNGACPVAQTGLPEASAGRLSLPLADEEIVWRGRKVVWSVGDHVRKQFTLPSVVTQVLWCTFDDTTVDHWNAAVPPPGLAPSGADPSPVSGGGANPRSGSPLERYAGRAELLHGVHGAGGSTSEEGGRRATRPSRGSLHLCLVCRESIVAFSTQGAYDSIPLPFTEVVVTALHWRGGGLLVQNAQVPKATSTQAPRAFSSDTSAARGPGRMDAKEDAATPSLLFLAHPQEEPVPVSAVVPARGPGPEKHQAAAAPPMEAPWDGDDRVIWVSDASLPFPLVVTYNRVTRRHALWQMASSPSSARARDGATSPGGHPLAKPPVPDAAVTRAAGDPRMTGGEAGLQHGTPIQVRGGTQGAMGASPDEQLYDRPRSVASEADSGSCASEPFSPRLSLSCFWSDGAESATQATKVFHATDLDGALLVCWLFSKGADPTLRVLRVSRGPSSVAAGATAGSRPLSATLAFSLAARDAVAVHAVRGRASHPVSWSAASAGGNAPLDILILSPAGDVQLYVGAHLVCTCRLPLPEAPSASEASSQAPRTTIPVKDPNALASPPPGACIVRLGDSVEGRVTATWELWGADSTAKAFTVTTTRNSPRVHPVSIPFTTALGAALSKTATTKAAPTPAPGRGRQVAARYDLAALWPRSPLARTALQAILASLPKREHFFSLLLPLYLRLLEEREQACRVLATAAVAPGGVAVAVVPSSTAAGALAGQGAPASSTQTQQSLNVELGINPTVRESAPSGNIMAGPSGDDLLGGSASVQDVLGGGDGFQGVVPDLEWSAVTALLRAWVQAWSASTSTHGGDSSTGDARDKTTTGGSSMVSGGPSASLGVSSGVEGASSSAVAGTPAKSSAARALAAATPHSGARHLGTPLGDDDGGRGEDDGADDMVMSPAMTPTRPPALLGGQSSASSMGAGGHEDGNVMRGAGGQGVSASEAESPWAQLLASGYHQRMVKSGALMGALFQSGAAASVRAHGASAGAGLGSATFARTARDAAVTMDVGGALDHVGKDGQEAAGGAARAVVCAFVTNHDALSVHALVGAVEALHAVYEDLKMDTVRCRLLPPLASLLFQLSHALDLPAHRDAYARDFPELFSTPCTWPRVSIPITSATRHADERSPSPSLPPPQGASTHGESVERTPSPPQVGAATPARGAREASMSGGDTGPVTRSRARGIMAGAQQDRGGGTPASSRSGGGGQAAGDAKSASASMSGSGQKAARDAMAGSGRNVGGGPGSGGAPSGPTPTTAGQDLGRAGAGLHGVAAVPDLFRGIYHMVSGEATSEAIGGANAGPGAPREVGIPASWDCDDGLRAAWRYLPRLHQLALASMAQEAGGFSLVEPGERAVEDGLVSGGSSLGEGSLSGGLSSGRSWSGSMGGSQSTPAGEQGRDASTALECIQWSVRLLHFLHILCRGSNENYSKGGKRMGDGSGAMNSKAAARQREGSDAFPMHPDVPSGAPGNGRDRAVDTSVCARPDLMGSGKVISGRAGHSTDQAGGNNGRAGAATPLAIGRLETPPPADDPMRLSADLEDVAGGSGQREGRERMTDFVSCPRDESQYREDYGTNCSAPHELVLAMVACGFGLGDLDRVPAGVAVVLREALQSCQEDPPSGWPPAAYTLIGREDMAWAATDRLDGALGPSAPHAFFLNPSSAATWGESVEVPAGGAGARGHPGRAPGSSMSESISGIGGGGSLSSGAAVAGLLAGGSGLGAGAPGGVIGVGVGGDGRLEDEPVCHDGMEEVVAECQQRLWMADDLRVLEVRRLLQSSTPIPVKLGSTAEGNDPDIVAQQQARLWLLGARTMALPFGRGAFSLATSRQLLTEPLPIPKLELSGRLLAKKNAMVALDVQAVSNGPALLAWPQFHNGVAAGLRLSRGQAKIARTWIVYNRPAEPSETHAGLLMALGLQGHLSALSAPDMYPYLSQEHVPTTVGLLLGAAAACRGSMHSSISKILFLHIPGRHPSSYPELELSPLVQAAALLSVGLLYQGSAHRLMTEILLDEIGKRPGGESAQDLEGYSLAAGLALGLVTLGQGSTAVGLADLGLCDRLHMYISPHDDTRRGHRSRAGRPRGGGRAGWAEADRPKGTRSRSADDNSMSTGNIIQEGDMINCAVTAPGATLALGLMYLKSNSAEAAARVAIPSTHFALDFVRPDFVLLRVLASGLILWDSVSPTKAWVEGLVPPVIADAVSAVHAGEWERLVAVDVGAVVQTHVHIMAGACLAMGIRYAGTAHEPARDTLLEYAHMLIRMKRAAPAVLQDPPVPGGLTKPSSFVDKASLETCLDTVALALSVVMAGTGDLKTLQLLRLLRRRVDGGQAGSGLGSITYGNHMAVSMALGFLFMGGGARTFCRSNEAIAALVVALFPVYPASPSDNRFYLQAFRHLYVLATENRAADAVDVDTRNPVPVPLAIQLAPDQPSTRGWDGAMDQARVLGGAGGADGGLVSKGAEPVTIYRVTPCLLPEASELLSVKVCGPHFWEQTIYERDGGAESLTKGSHRQAASKSGTAIVRAGLQRAALPPKPPPRLIRVKRRVSWRMAMDDPFGCGALLSQGFSQGDDGNDAPTTINGISPLALSVAARVVQHTELERNRVREGVMANAIHTTSVQTGTGGGLGAAAGTGREVDMHTGTGAIGGAGMGADAEEMPGGGAGGSNPSGTGDTATGSGVMGAGAVPPVSTPGGRQHERGMAMVEPARLAALRELCSLDSSASDVAHLFAALLFECSSQEQLAMVQVR